VHVALAQDHRKHEVIVHRLFAELQHCELAFGKENKDPYGDETRVMVHSQVGLLMAFCKTVCQQAVVDHGFEKRYWAGDPDDTYARAIRLLNKQICYVRDPGVFLAGFLELSTRDVAEVIATRTNLTIQDWCYSIARREYDKDDFIPSLHPDACPSNVFNVFEGLAIQHKDCRDVDIADAKPLVDLIRDSLCNGNQGYCDFYLEDRAVDIAPGLRPGARHQD